VRWAERWTLRLPPVEPGAVVVHGASVGEGRAAHALFEAFRALDPTTILLRTATSDTGLLTARGQHVVAALPMEAVAANWVDRVRPGALVLVEAEIWPNLLAACARREVPVYLVNPRIGPGMKRLQRWAPGLLRRCMEGVTVLDVGDPKLDAPAPPCRVHFPESILVGASLREGDTERLLTAWDALAEKPILLLAPRHPKSFDRRLLTGRDWCRVGQGTAPIQLLDTVGELASFFPQACAAYIGGGFDPSLGGHSAAEALACGVPVFHGPHGRGGLATEDLTLGVQQALSLGPQPPRRSGAAARVAESVHTRTPAERSYRPLPAFWPVSATTPVRVDRFVISVGNLASGGTGKTPVTAFLARRLDATVLTRGYRGGDEARMLRDQGLCVVVDIDRVRGAGRATTHCVVLDDGFQHRRLHRDLDIVCIDGWHPTAGGVLPRGEARESWEALQRADLIWVTRGSVPDTTLPVVVSELQPVGWLHRGRCLPLDALQGPVHGFAGIHRPGRFLQSLAPLLRVEGFDGFPDHYAYTDADMRRLSAIGLPLVTTEKDLVRFPGDAWALRTELVIVSGEEHLERLLAARRTA
jgi:tetraacyldisaccharide 4'-kinase